MGERFQKVLLFLRKLGILRYGATSFEYTSGKDMPGRALLDNVYDEKKDLLKKDDLRKK